MVVETEVLRYWQWLFGTEQAWGGALSQLAIVVVSVSLIALLVGFLVAAVRYGPLAAGDMTYRVTFYLPYPASTVTRYTHTITNLANARALAERVYRSHRKHGPVTILNDVGEVVISDFMVEDLVKGTR